MKKSNGISEPGGGMLRAALEGQLLGFGRGIDRSKALGTAIRAIETASESDEPVGRNR